MTADAIPDSAIEALARLLLNAAELDPCEPSCTRCGEEANHLHAGEPYCELCRGCYANQQNILTEET